MKNFIFVLLPVFSIVVYSQPSSPILRIQTGFHTSKGYKIATDAGGKFLLTSSLDKTARLWDASNGGLLKTFHIPLGGVREGALFASSLSPDGRIAALSGDTGFEWDNDFCIYLINTQTGAIINRIKNLPGVISDLEFSPDGNWLAAGLNENKGVYVFDTKGWGKTKLPGNFTGDVNSIAFKPDGGLAAASTDGKIMLYNSHFEVITERKGLTGHTIKAIAFDPPGVLLAIGYSDVAIIEVMNAANLSLLYKPVFAEQEYDGFETLCFSADGSRLYAGGGFQKFVTATNAWKRTIRCWSNSGKGSYTDLFITDNYIADIQPMADGSISFMCFDPPEMARINPAGTTTWYNHVEKNDYTSSDKSHFRINNTGNSIGFAQVNQLPLSFDIQQRKLAEEQSLYPAPVETNSGTVVNDWNRNWNPLINGKPIPGFANKNYQECISTDISSDGRKIALGSSWYVILLDNTTKVLWEAPVESHPWAINISGNDKIVAAAFTDGIIRWYSMETGKELLSFYLLPDKKRWLLYTPTGYYDAAPGAEEALWWHLNNGPDEAPGFYPASRFKEKFYRPDIIDAIFETYNEETAIALADKNNSGKLVTRDADIRQKLPPTIIINSPVSGSTISSNTVSVSYLIKSPADAPAKDFRVLIDGRPTAIERGVKLTQPGTQTVTVSVPSADCTITLLAENDNGTSPETNLYLKWTTATAASTEDLLFKPKLYVLAIGVSDYNNPDLKLGLASKDAGDFADAIYKQKGILFNDVVIKKLTDKEATKDNMTDGLDWIQRQTGQKDVAMIFYAGHGINDNNGVFYMLPVMADLDRIRTTCLNFEELKQTVSSIAGKVVVFIDACHSGNVMGSTRRGTTDINAMVNELSSTENGAITFTSSTGKEFSLEDPAWGNGAFTKAVIEGLGGMAAINGKNKITTKSLDAYISERVKELTKGRQHPTSVTPPNVPDFPIAAKE